MTETRCRRGKGGICRWRLVECPVTLSTIHECRFDFGGGPARYLRRRHRRGFETVSRCRAEARIVAGAGSIQARAEQDAARGGAAPPAGVHAGSSAWISFAGARGGPRVQQRVSASSAGASMHAWRHWASSGSTAPRVWILICARPTQGAPDQYSANDACHRSLPIGRRVSLQRFTRPRLRPALHLGAAQTAGRRRQASSAQ